LTKERFYAIIKLLITGIGGLTMAYLKDFKLTSYTGDCDDLYVEIYLKAMKYRKLLINTYSGYYKISERLGMLTEHFINLMDGDPLHKTYLGFSQEMKILLTFAIAEYGIEYAKSPEAPGFINLAILKALEKGSVDELMNMVKDNNLSEIFEKISQNFKD